MDKAITGMFVKGNSLHLVRGSDIWSVTDNGKEPNQWDQVLFANVGGSEEFIQQLSCELPELVGASSIHGEDRKRVEESIMVLLTEGLMPAFENLKRIRLSISGTLPELERRQNYESFARELWHAYADLMPRTAKLLGFEVRFLFKDDKKFENGVKEFEQEHPELSGKFRDAMREQRVRWRNGLGDFRNDYLEHRKDETSKYNRFYEPQYAELLFHNVWRVIADILPTLIAMHFAPSVNIEEIPAGERDCNRPRRFRYI
jgi:hypothetical protein